jgi:hypothetical protein
MGKLLYTIYHTSSKLSQTHSPLDHVAFPPLEPTHALRELPSLTT